MAEEGTTFGLTGVEIEGQLPDKKPLQIVTKKEEKISQPIKEEKKQPQQQQVQQEKPKVEKPKEEKKTPPPIQTIQAPPQKKDLQVMPQTTKPQTSSKNELLGSKSNGKLPPIKKELRKNMSQTTTQLLSRKQKLEALKDVMKDLQKNKEQLKREKKGKDKDSRKSSLDFLRLYQQKIIQEYDSLYTNSNYEKVIEELKALEKKTFLDSEIQRNEEYLNQAKKMYNDNMHSIEKKSVYLKKLKEQIEEIDALSAEEAQLLVQEKIDEKNKLINQNADVEFFKQSLQYMVEDRKKKVNNVKTGVGQMYKKLSQLQFHIILYQSEKINQEKCSSERDKDLLILRRQIEDYKQYNMKLSEHFEEQLENELSEFEDKKALQEIFKHESKRKDEQEKELQAQKEEEIQRLREEKNKEQQKIKEETRQVEKKLEKLDKNFDKLREKTHENNVGEFLKHKSYLETCKTNIGGFQDMFEQKIEQTKEEIVVLQQKVKIMKYESQADQEDDGHIILEDQVEHELLTENDKCYKMEQESKRVRRVIDNVSTVISRILYQLQGKQNKNKNIEVSKDDLLNKISICSLRLEKMLAILSKKKDTIRVESVNTDSTYVKPPDFLGVNHRTILIKQQEGVSVLSQAGGDHSVNFSYKESEIDEWEEHELENIDLLRKKIRSPDDYQIMEQQQLEQQQLLIKKDSENKQIK